MFFIPPTRRVKGYTRLDGNYVTGSKLACPCMENLRKILYLINLKSSSYPLI